jgi:DNA transformation protein
VATRHGTETGPVSVKDSFLEYVREQIGRTTPVTARKMFGGVGLYARGLFFGLIDDDVLYFKVGEANRADFVTRGMEPFRPYGPDGEVMQYYEVPGDLLDDPETLRTWVEKALAVAAGARQRGTRRRRRPR